MKEVLRRETYRSAVGGDRSADRPVAGADPGRPSGGFGVDLVTELFSAWGVERGPQGTTVWLELPVRARVTVQAVIRLTSLWAAAGAPPHARCRARVPAPGHYPAGRRRIQRLVRAGYGYESCSLKRARRQGPHRGQCRLIFETALAEPSQEEPCPVSRGTSDGRPGCLRAATTARERMIKRHLPLADRLARRYRHTSEPLDAAVVATTLRAVRGRGVAGSWSGDRANARRRLLAGLSICVDFAVSRRRGPARRPGLVPSIHATSSNPDTEPRDESPRRCS